MTGRIRYETIGQGYARTRRPDPRIAARVHTALDGAQTVLNVGAGTGNYEPSDRTVVAVEPAAAMLAQRPPAAAPAVQATAEALPFGDATFDAALATFTVHHWNDLTAGLGELRRVARRQVILMNEPEIGRRFWLVDYFPEVLALPAEVNAPTVADIQQHLAVQSVSPVPVPAGCTDGFVCAYWNRPEAYLDPAVRAGMSTLAQLAPDAVAHGVQRLRDDLDSHAWDVRYGHLRDLQAHDYGYRLIGAGDAEQLSLTPSGPAAQHRAQRVEHRGVVDGGGHRLLLAVGDAAHRLAQDLARPGLG